MISREEFWIGMISIMMMIGERLSEVDYRLELSMSLGGKRNFQMKTR